MANVIVFPRGQLSDADRARLAAMDIVAVEADDPRAVVTVVPSSHLVCPDDLLAASLQAVATSPFESVAANFAKALHKRLVARETSATQEPTHDDLGREGESRNG